MKQSRSSGIYVIDSDYKIVSFNRTAKEIYPMLRKGEKCFKVLMNLERPCPLCPVYNQVMGPTTYIDPIRHIKETVDAVEMTLEDDAIGHALVFSTVPDDAPSADINAAPRRTILICEDNEHLRELLVEYLKDTYEILEAADGNEGWELLNKHEQDISVILTELAMPNCSGYDLMERIMGNTRLSVIPIVVMTGDEDDAAEERCLALGAVDFLQKPVRPAIVKSRLRNLIQMQESTASLRDIERDNLTGLYTRHAFFHHAKRLMDANPHTAFDVLIADIENFKYINFTHGEEKGDEILMSLADFIKLHFPHDICARYGPDVLAWMIPTSEVDIKKWVGELLQQFTAGAPIPNLVVKCGIYQHVDRSLQVNQMCDRALLALMSIKHNHSRSVALFDGPVSQRLLKAQHYESEFQDALSRKEFVLYYQPKYDPFTQKVVGLEALVRWNQNGKMISPAEFLPAFEDSRLIIQLDEYVFRTVCAYQRKLKEQGRELVPISVNVSRRSMYLSDVVERYKKIVAENGISPTDIPIEITESAAIGGIEIKPLADAFSDVGFSLHMDDFGSGRSSLSDLNILHFDVIKIDKSLIDHIGDQRGELLLTYSMALAKKLGLYLVAEGVETKEQLDFLKKRHCDAIQGYYFSKPLPVEELEKKLYGNQKYLT